MKLFTSFASGSGGNSSLYINGKTKVLIDCGTTTKYITYCLAQLDLKPADLTHILLTHAHSDHISALSVLKKQTGAQILCTADTAAAVRARVADFAPTEFEAGAELELGAAMIKTFETPHDIVGSCGFVFDKTLAYCTDFGHMSAEIFAYIKDAKNIFIESNHDVGLLENGPYPYNLKCRILSPYGHLSNEDCGRAVEKLVQSGANRIILAHLSDKNNTPRHARAESEMALMRAGAEAEVSLSIAPKSDVMEPILL